MLDFDEICRVCMRSDQEVKLIFDEKHSEGSTALATMLGECTKYEVFRFDALPQQMCNSCIKALKSAYRFKHTCEESYRHLMQILWKSESDEHSNIENSIQAEPSSHINKNTQEKYELHPCEHCDVKCNTIKQLLEHRAMVHKDSPIVCRFCSQKFSCVGYLISHMAIYHPESGYESSNKCTICKREFLRKQQLVQHLQKVHNRDAIGNKLTKIDATTTESHKYDDENNRLFAIKTEDDGILEDIEMDPVEPLQTVLITESLELQNMNLEQEETICKNNDYMIGDLVNVIIDNEDSNVASLSKESQADSELYNEEGEVYQEESKLYQDESELQQEGKSEIQLEDSELLEDESEADQEKNDLHPCERCDKKFFDIGKLRAHRLSNHKDAPIQCRFCFKKYSRVGYLRSHMAICHPGFGYKSRSKCEICKREFVRRQHLIKHIKQVHKEGDDGNNCKINEGSNFNEKNNEYGNNEDPNATIPKKKSNSKENSKIFCKECKKFYANDKQFKKHWNENHNEEKVYHFNCRECAQSFDSRKALYDHRMAVGHGTFLCPKCGLRCISNSALTVHMRRHNGEKPFKCKFCNRGFPGADSLHRHQIHHTEEKNYFCETCGKAFYSRVHLNVHIRVHTGEKPYKCPYCPQAFAQKPYLTIHIRLHTGERLICEYCDQGFLQLTQLRQHKLMEHGIDEGPTTNRISKFTSLESQKEQIKAMQKSQQIE